MSTQHTRSLQGQLVVHEGSVLMGHIRADPETSAAAIVYWCGQLCHDRLPHNVEHNAYQAGNATMLIVG